MSSITEYRSTCLDLSMDGKFILTLWPTNTSSISIGETLASMIKLEPTGTIPMIFSAGRTTVPELKKFKPNTSPLTGDNTVRSAILVFNLL